MDRFAGRVVVIVGAASEIGAAAADRFRREGAVVVGVDTVAHDVGDESIVADATDEAAIAAVYDRVVAERGRLDVVYNNVGRMSQGDGSALGVPLETWNAQLAVNLTAIMLSCKHAVPHLRATAGGRGAIVNAASFLGEMGAATAPMAYSAAKAAVIQLTRDLGVHLARSGVRVNAIAFGPIETAAQRAVLERSPEVLAARIVHWPMGRYGTLEEAAGAIAFLASDDAGFLTGHTLPLDGGIARAFTVPD